jgi:hypothetical protein
MKNNHLDWKKTLTELNNFHCRIEFLQSRIRDFVVERKGINIGDYIKELNKFIEEHEYNLYSIEDKNNMVVFIMRDLIMSENLTDSINTKTEILS